MMNNTTNDDFSKILKIKNLPNPEPLLMKLFSK